jgi:hypothetical protein
MSGEQFTQLEQIYQMFTPQDLVGTVQPNLGGPLEKVNNAFVQLLALLENNGRGILSITDLIEQVNQLKTNSQLGSVDLSQYLTIWSNQGVPDLGPTTAMSQLAQDPTGATTTVNNLKEVIGADFAFPDGTSVVPPNVSLILSKSPFFNPATRNTKKAEIFLNSMPSSVLAQLVPYMQVEFQFTRDPADQLQTLGLTKFLLGAVSKGNLSAADNAIIEGHQIVGDANKQIPELDFAGMEMFTAPQTLVNPLPNQNVGTGGSRYSNIVDPFRPFGTLESVTISAKPSGAGFFCYKKANMALKIHDRSRLNEISDLLRPRVYTGVTIWMTYGWRAPVRGDKNAYFAYVNNNLMMREPYHIVNSSFSFDNMGQVTINLELFTKGVTELRELKISDHSGDMAFRTGEVKRLIEVISQYRQRLKLDPPEGLNKEIRVYQILDAAEIGEFPDMDASDVSKQIDALKAGLKANPDKDAVNGLITALKTLYTPDGNKKKFTFKERYETRLTATIDNMFEQVQTGPDPFLPTAGKGLGSEITKVCDRLNAPPTTKAKAFRKRCVSFGKLFTVFSLRGILSVPDAIDEVQVFFYNLNEHCGPISSHSIAEFPIDMDMFLDQFHDLAKSKGGEKITLEDFLALAINGQFLDNYSIGYGLRDYYTPYKKGQDPQVNKEQDFESKLASYTNTYGPFKKPTVEMYIEMSHRKVSQAGDSDILQLLNYSAKDASTVSLQDAKGNSTARIMRIHVYDKQTNAYSAASQLLKNANNTGFLNANPALDDTQKKWSPNSGAAGTISGINTSTGTALAQDVAQGKVTIQDLSSFKSNQQIKDVVSKLVPTIRYGANGTTITQASLTSKADPLLSTVQMIRSQTVKNTAAPNGGGTGGIPLRVIPAQLSMTTMGNPLATMAQLYFVDFGTGTTLDNLYIVIGLDHTFAPGKFETKWNFGYADGYGQFEGAPTFIGAATKLSPDGSTG